MKSKLVWEKSGERTFVLILDPGEEAFAAITEFAGCERLSGAGSREAVIGHTAVLSHRPGSPRTAATRSDALAQSAAGRRLQQYEFNGFQGGMVELRGIEPLTSSLRTRRSPN
jgi:hypothetical protein